MRGSASHPDADAAVPHARFHLTDGETSSFFSARHALAGQLPLGDVMRIKLHPLNFERRGNWPCLISLVKAVRARVRNLILSSVRGPDHFLSYSCHNCNPFAERVSIAVKSQTGSDNRRSRSISSRLVRPPRASLFGLRIGNMPHRRRRRSGLRRIGKIHLSIRSAALAFRNPQIKFPACNPPNIDRTSASESS